MSDEIGRVDLNRQAFLGRLDELAASSETGTRTNNQIVKKCGSSPTSSPAAAP